MNPLTPAPVTPASATAPSAPPAPLPALHPGGPLESPAAGPARPSAWQLEPGAALIGAMYARVMERRRV